MATSLGAARTVALYGEAKAQVARVRAVAHVEVIRVSASDGVPVKALFLAPLSALGAPAGSVPLAIYCHGMSGDYWQAGSLYHALVSRGYAVLAPESRGHGSNPAPSTLGLTEPGDVIQLLDHLEVSPAHAYLNASAVGIVGSSMGGLHATLAYIQESLGRGRMRALASLSGPVNLSREVAFYTNRPDRYGDMWLVKDLAAKNPVTMVNATFPTNVLLVHGTADSVVDYRCSTDFAARLDPDGTRQDVRFVWRPDEGHGVAGNHGSMREAVAWLDQYVRGVSTDPGNVTLAGIPFSTRPARDANVACLGTVVALVVVIGAAALLGRPAWFTPVPRPWRRGPVGRLPALPGTASEPTYRPTPSHPPEVLAAGGGEKPAVKRARWDDPRVHLLGYYAVFFVAGCVMLLSPAFILNELVFGVIAVTAFTAVVYLRGHPSARARLRDHLKPKAALAWLVAIALPIGGYFLVTGHPRVEDATLVAGARWTGWIPFFTLTLGLLLGTNVLLLRHSCCARVDRARVRLLEPWVNGLLVAGGLFLFFLWSLDAWVYLPMLSLSFPLVPVVALGVGGLFALFDDVVQACEFAGKTIVPGCVACGLVVALALGNSPLIFFY